MMMLCFSLGDERFALDTVAVREVIPMVSMKKIPIAPDWVAGVMRYHGEVVPVIDLCLLNIQQPAARQLSTRIILINFIDHQGRERLLGLLAEKVTEILRQSPDEFSQTGIKTADAPWLGGVSDDRKGMVQLIAVEKLLPAKVQDILFQQAGDKAQ